MSKPQTPFFLAYRNINNESITADISTLELNLGYTV